VDKGKKKAEKKDEWTSDVFAQTFIDTEPVSRTAILSRAIKAGLSNWTAERLLRYAESEGLVVRIGEGKRNQPCTYKRILAVAKNEEECL